MKICFICFDFTKENIRRQPWNYVYRLSKALKKKGEDVVVLTDKEIKEVDDIRTRKIPTINSFVRRTGEIRAVLREECPDVIVALIGVTTFLRKSMDSNIPTIGLLTSPIYSPREIIRVGLREFVIHLDYLIIHLIGSVLSPILLRRGISSLDAIVVLSEKNRRKIENLGAIDKVLLIPPGIEESFLGRPDCTRINRLKSKLNIRDEPILMYFTSPLTLRGTDTLMKAFIIVRRRLDSRLIILSRQENTRLIHEEKALMEIAEKGGVEDSVTIVRESLSPNEIIDYLSLATIVCLPFKLVISDVPLSVLEAMSRGKAVISTRVGCLPEILENRGVIINPNDSIELADAIFKLLEDKNLFENLSMASKEFMNAYPSWDNIAARFIELTLQIIKKHDNLKGDRQ